MNRAVSMPYSEKALKSLQEILEVHQSFVWHDPVTNSFQVKKLTPAQMRPLTADGQDAP